MYVYQIINFNHISSCSKNDGQNVRCKGNLKRQVAGMAGMGVVALPPLHTSHTHGVDETLKSHRGVL